MPLTKNERRAVNLLGCLTTLWVAISICCGVVTIYFLIRLIPELG